MSVPYRIHLRGPWQYEWLAGPTPVASSQESPESELAHPPQSSGRVRMPIDWQAHFGPVAGKIRFTRRFHQPTNLDDVERVMLTLEGIGGAATITLNDRPLGGVRSPQQPVSFEITRLLQPNSVLIIDVTYHPDEHGPRGGLWGSVVIEIDEGVSAGGVSD